MLIIQEKEDAIHASFDGISRFNCLFNKEVESKLIPFIEDQKKELILNLSGITFIDSAGFDTILNMHKKAAEKNYRFMVTNPSNDVKELFDLLKLNSILLVSEN